MNTKLKKILKIIIPLIVVYLFISAIYIAVHINFGTEPIVAGMGFSNSTNLLRTFLGLPKTCTTYEGVSPIYLIKVVIEIIIEIVLLIFYSKINEKLKKKFSIIISIIIVAIIALIIVVDLLITKDENLEQKANEIFGSSYCDGNHETIDEGKWKFCTCELCGGDCDIGKDIRVICNNCAELTGRCQKCGKLK